MTVTRSQLKVGMKVSVPAFEGTVTDLHAGEQEFYGCTEVRSSSGWTHFIFREEMSLVAPYKDGQAYMDKDGDRLIFRKNGHISGKAGWETGSGNIHAYDYATRPLKEEIGGPSYGPEIEEE